MNKITQSLRRAYLANIITQFGSSLAFIPLGNYFGKKLGIGEGYAVLLILMSLPAILLARLYATMAIRFGIQQLIAFSELTALGFSLISVLAVTSGNFILLLVSVSLTFCASTSISSLFPSVLNSVSVSDRSTVEHFSKWYLYRHAVLILSRVVGGHLSAYFEIQSFLIIDAVTFGVAFAIWFKIPWRIQRSAIIPSLKTSQFSFAQFLEAPLLGNLVRGIAYGVLNSALAFLVLSKFGQTSAELGNLYFALGAGAIVGSFLVKRMPLSYGATTIAIVGEFSFLIAALTGATFGIFAALLTVAVMLMAAVEVLLQALYLRYGRSGSSEARSTTFNAAENVANVIGYFAYAAIANKIGVDSLIILISVLGILSLFAVAPKVIKRTRL